MIEKMRRADGCILRVGDNRGGARKHNQRSRPRGAHQLVVVVDEAAVASAAASAAAAAAAAAALATSAKMRREPGQHSSARALYLRVWLPVGVLMRRPPLERPLRSIRLSPSSAYRNQDFLVVVVVGVVVVIVSAAAASAARRRRRQWRRARAEAN